MLGEKQKYQRIYKNERCSSVGGSGGLRRGGPGAEQGRGPRRRRRLALAARPPHRSRPGCIPRPSRWSARPRPPAVARGAIVTFSWWLLIEQPTWRWASSLQKVLLDSADLDLCLSRGCGCHVLEIMNPVYSPGSSGVPYANAKGIGYPAGFPMGYAAAAPTYSPNMYPGANPTFQTGYTPGTPYKVSCSPTSGAVPPYSSSPNPYQTAVYPVRSAYPQQSPYAQQGTYCTQPLYAAPPHVVHHTTVVQPNGMPMAVYPAPIPPPTGNGVTMGMVAGTTMAMSAGTLLTAHSPTPVAPHRVKVPTYRAPGTPTYSYVPPPWWSPCKCLRMELCVHIMEVPQLVLQAWRLQPGLSS